MEDFDFTEDEIREQLEILGYSSVPKQRLQEFKRDLESLVKHERSKNSSLFSTSEQSSSSDSEVHRNRHLHVNGVSRAPLDDTNHRPITSNFINGSKTDHTSNGKENLLISAPGLPGDHSHSRGPLDNCRPARVPDYSMYAAQAHTSHQRHAEEDDTEEPDTTLDTTTSTERRTIKRKVLRKRDGHTEIYETESESGDVDGIQERLRDIGLSVHISRPSTAPTGRRRPHSADAPSRRQLSARDANPCYRLPEDYDGLKALIRPMSCEPHQKNVKKADPVSKYQQYRMSWQCHRAPGEKAHKGLRWGVREQMLYHDQVVSKKQHKTYVPNGYTVPSDKKRKDLRWQIRNDLAQGVVPPSMFD